MKVIAGKEPRHIATIVRSIELTAEIIQLNRLGRVHCKRCAGTFELQPGDVLREVREVTKNGNGDTVTWVAYVTCSCLESIFVATNIDVRYQRHELYARVRNFIQKYIPSIRLLSHS